jgi:glucose uptake protein GlcU
MPTKKLGKKNNKKAGIPAFFYKEKEVLVVSTSFYLLFLILLPFCKFKKFTKLFFGDAGVHCIFNELCPFGV